MHVLILHSLKLQLQTAIWDSIISNCLLGAGCLLISNNLKYYLPKRQQFWYVLAFSLGITMLWLFMLNLIIMAWPAFTTDYTSFFLKSLPIRFAVGFIFIASIATTSVLWYAIEDQKESLRRKTETEKLAREAELYGLHQKLQPHFIFNSLNSISALAVSQPQKARQMIQQLSDFLRGILNKNENERILFSEELNHLQLYLEIEKVRFGHRLSSQIVSSETALQMTLPALLVQPIVENAIKFGLYDTTEAITISVSATDSDHMLTIKVQNPFDAETALHPQGTGFGLSSIHRRLQLLFGRSDLLQTLSEDGIFTTVLKIPQ